jgi:uncharacterized membrane protein (UPF0127 family)
MRKLRTLGLVGLAALAAAGPALSGCEPGAPSKPSIPTLTINAHVWSVDLAMTPKQRYDGLSGRPMIGDKSGMLFIYPTQQVLDFCMRGCPNPIDIAFIDSNRRIVRIHTMRPEPPDYAGRAAYSSDSPAQYAFETAGGALGAAGVKVGDVVAFSADIPEASKAQAGP